jgi:RimJ/RimL family protein N-acetyltransferase
MKFILNESLSEKEIRKAMSKVYQAYEKYNENDSNQNCMLCAWALEMQLRGNRSFLPRPVYSPRDVVFTEIDGGWLIVKKPRKIRIKKKLSVIQEVEEAEEGARFYCHVNWQDSTGGHEFLVLNIDGKAYVADAQANVLNLVEDDHTYFEDINWDNSLLVRLDNKEIDDNILKYNDDKYILEWDDELDPAFLKAQEDEITESLEKITYKPVEDIEQFKTYADQILGGDGNMSMADIQSSIKEIYIDNELVGYIGFSEYEEDDVKMLGIGNFMTIQQGKGHGTKIINDIVETKKNEYDLIYCFVDADNAGAIRLYKKLGTVYDEDGPNDNGQYYVTFYDNGKFDLDENFDPPYNEEQIKANYGDETYQRLIDDPAHAWRMKTGLELIHKEPSKKELERIWANWQEMTDEQKAESDKKSIELFGKTNEENYNELIKLYESVEKEPELYCISQEDLDGQTLEPRVPDNFFTKNGYEDGETPRVCFAPTIEQCLMGLSQNLKEKEFYAFSPEEVPEENIYKPTTKEVPDAEITDETWITCPVKLKKVGKIKVLGDSGLDGHPFNYGDKTAELYDWDWEWLD